MHRLCPGYDDYGNDVQRHEPVAQHELQLPGAGDGRDRNLSPYSNVSSATTLAFDNGGPPLSTCPLTDRADPFDQLLS